MNIKYLLLFICIFLTAHAAVAQIWVPVTHASGSRVINGRTVTVSSDGSVRTEGTFGYCGAGPYTIGINYNGIPGSYTYAFSPATTTVRFLMSATNIGEVNSFYINGVHYPLTPANLQPLPACDTQFQLPLSIQAGNVIFAGPVVPGQAWYGRFGSGIVEITYPAGIDSIRVHSNGIMGGTTYGFAYWGFYAEAFNDSACRGDTLHLFGGPTEPGVSYYWTGPNGFTSNSQYPVIPNADLVHEGLYTLRTIFNVDTAYDTTRVRIRPVPATPVVTADTVVCAGNTAYFNASSATSGVNYLWNGPNGYRSTMPNTSIRNVRDRDTGIYSVIATLNGCPSLPALVPLKVVHPVNGDTLPVQTCAGSTYDFFGRKITTAGIYGHTLSGASSYGCDSVTYISLSFTEPPRDTFSVNICQGSSYDFNGMPVTEPGFYIDTLQTSGGCDSVAVLELAINLATPDTLSISICQGSSYSFAGQSLTEAGSYIDTIKTAAGCDSVVVLMLATNPVAGDTLTVSICQGDSYSFAGQSLTEAGIYTDTVKTTAGCDSAIMLQLTVHALPAVTASYDSDRTPCLGDTIRLHGDGAVTYAWFRNGMQIGEQPIQPFVLTYEHNEVTLQGTNANECTDSAQFELSAIPCCNIFVPNAFTPNNDGRNDEFRIFTESRINQYQMDIMNRWGRLVFTSADISKSWDGTINGEPADVGTYFYQIKGKCLSGTEIYEKGDITLIR